jgi:hypothetical protein
MPPRVRRRRAAGGGVGHRCPLLLSVHPPLLGYPHPRPHAAPCTFLPALPLPGFQIAGRLSCHPFICNTTRCELCWAAPLGALRTWVEGGQRCAGRGLRAVVPAAGARLRSLVGPAPRVDTRLGMRAAACGGLIGGPGGPGGSCAPVYPPDCAVPRWGCLAGGRCPAPHTRPTTAGSAAPHWCAPPRPSIVCALPQQTNLRDGPVSTASARKTRRRAGPIAESAQHSSLPSNPRVPQGPLQRSWAVERGAERGESSSVVCSHALPHR